MPIQRRRKVFKSSGAITYERIFNGAIFSKLDSKANKKWWCHGTTAYDGADRKPPKGMKWPSEGPHYTWVQPGTVHTPRFLLGPTEFQSAWISVAA